MWEGLATPVGQRTLVWVLIALLVGPSVAGCLSDLEREQLELTWDPGITVHQGPVQIVDGLPTMVVVDGTVTIDPDATVEITGVEAELQQANQTVDLRLARLTVGERALRAGDLSETDPELSSGTPVRVTLLPGADQQTRLAPGPAANLSLELQWRFREDQRFDAGRLSVDRNVTVTPPGDLGLGAAVTADDTVETLVFPAVGRQVPLVAQGVDVFAVKTDGVSRLGPAEVTFRQGEGVALADLDQGVGLPDDHGYLVFVLQEGPLEGTAVHGFGELEQSTPGPGAWLTLGAVIATALILAPRGRSGRWFR